MKNVTLSGGMPKRNGIGRFVAKNRNKIIEAISAVFILLFLYTAISKSFDIHTTVNALKMTPVISSIAEPTAWTVVSLEYIAALLLFLPNTRKLGLIGSLGLMISFTGYIAYMKAFVEKLPCTCGGVISEMTWTEHLIFNVLLIVLASFAIHLGSKNFNPDSKEPDTIPIVFT